MNAKYDADKVADRLDWLDLDHCRLPWKRVGSGPDVVFVHGWPLDSRTWDPLVERLKDRFTCHLIDLPGTGDSEWSEATPAGPSGHIAALSQAISKMDLGPYALVAHDSGAVFARMIAAKDPRVTGLVMGNTEIPGHHPWMLNVLLAAHKLPGSEAMMAAMMRSRTFRRSFMGFGGCFEDKAFIDGAFHDRFVAPLIASRRALRGQARLMDGFDWSLMDGLPAIHQAITAPVQLIWGANDPWFPLEKARAMPAQFGGECALHVLDPGKLFAHEEFPSEFAAVAGPFLSSCFD